MRLRLACACAVIVGAGWACTESTKDAGRDATDGGAESAGSSAAGEFADAYTSADRDHFTRCCHQVGMMGPSQGTPFRLPSARSGARFDAAAAKKCLGEIESLPCELEKQAHPVPPSCGSVFSRGDVAVGEPCASEFECAQPVGKITSCIERYVDKKAQFRCVTIREAQEADPCMSDDPDEWINCPSPLICDTDRNVCSARAKLGETCVTGPIYGDTCAGGAVCDRNDTHECVKPKAIEDPCSKPEDCEALACIDGVCVKPLFALPVCGK